MHIILKSTITCPYCQYQKIETMPQDRCQLMYQCANCQQVFRPNGESKIKSVDVE